MAAPGPFTIAPVSGLSIGSTFVDITGTGFNLAAVGSVRVFFDNVPATEVQVVSATRVVCLTPRHTPSTTAVDVRVENVTPDPPNADIVEATVQAAAYTYSRPDLSTPDDLSNYTEITLITRALVQQLRDFVIEETHSDRHPEYASAADAAVPQESKANLPHLKLLGPTIAENRFFSVNTRQDQPAVTQGPLQAYDIHAEPKTVDLTYTYLGVGRSGGEVTNLWIALMLYFKRTPDLTVFRDGISGATVQYEMDPIREVLGDFTDQSGNDGVSQFSGEFVVRGVDVLTDFKVGIGVEQEGTATDPVTLLDSVPLP